MAEYEMDKYLTRYVKAFHSGFPMYQLGRGRSEEEIIEIIKRCLSAGKDVYELGLLRDDDDAQY